MKYNPKQDIERLKDFCTVGVKSEGFDEAYQKLLKKELKYAKMMMWWAFSGWVLTVIFYNT